MAQDFKVKTHAAKFADRVWVSASSLMDAADSADAAGHSQTAQALRQIAAHAFNDIEKTLAES